MAHSANSDAIINDDSTYGISHGRKRKLTMVIFESPIIEDDNDQSQKSFKLDLGKESPNNEIKVPDGNSRNLHINKCRTIR